MGVVFKAPAFIVFIGGGLWGLALQWGYLTDHIGTFLTLVSMVFLPFVFTFLPLYAGLVDGHWLMLLVSWGTLFGGSALYCIGSLIDGD